MTVDTSLDIGTSSPGSSCAAVTRVYHPERDSGTSAGLIGP
jgi:hypothetical protein